MYQKRFLAAFTAFLLLLSLILIQPTFSAPAATPDLLRSLRQQSDSTIQVDYHAETGKVRFLRTDSGHPIARPSQLAAGATAEQAARKAMDHGLRTVDVFVKGPGSGREMAIRALQSAGVNVVSITDTTPIPHNGCRPPKRRRV